MPHDDLKPLGKHGGVRPGAGRPRKGEIRERKIQRDDVGDNVTLNSNSRGNSVDYIIARLRREGCDDLIEAIANRKISAFAIAVELGWAKRRILGTGSENQAKRRAFDVRALIG